MQFLRRALPVLVTCCFLLLGHDAYAKKVFVDSTPEGARVEINNALVCTTPCVLEVPGAYFGVKHWSGGSRLEKPYVIRLTKEGYAPKEAPLSTGPREFRDGNGILLFVYFYFKEDHFNILLDPVQSFAGDSPAAVKHNEPATDASTESLPIEQIVRNSLPAMVQIHTTDGSGSGFFITSEGLVATNAHVVGTEQSVRVITSDRKTLVSDHIYVDHDRDLALIKVAVHDVSFLRLNPSLPNPGAEVIAIGTPGINDVAEQSLLPNSVSKGVVSGIRTFSDTTIANVSRRAGNWIQTDTTINHGNSGGPLINHAGLVVGINTLGFGGTGTPGINFALASPELITVVREHLGITLRTEPTAAEHSGLAEFHTSAKLSITSTPANADIEIDGVFLGNTPSDLAVAEGKRVVKITKKGYQPYERTLQVQPGGSQRIAAELDPVAAP